VRLTPSFVSSKNLFHLLNLLTKKQPNTLAE